MDEKEFCRAITGIIAPWEISRIAANEQKRRVDVYLEYSKEDGECPECGKPAVLYDKRESRIRRHPDSCEYRTFLHCRMPRSKCPEHGIKTMTVSRAGNMSHFTESFERHAIDVLNISKSRSRTAGLPGISRDGISGIMRRPVSRGLEKRTGAKIKYPGTGEKSFLKGQSYAGVLTDIEGKRVIDAAENRDIPAVTALIDRLKEEQRAGIKAISMDFRKAYISVCGLKVKNGDIVHDKFHIAKYMNGAVNAVRIAEHKRRKKAGDAGLTGTKFLRLKKPENFTDKDKKKRAELNPDQLEVGKARMPRELFNGFWNCPNITGARKIFKARHNKATHSGLEPMVKVAQMIKNHFGNIITRRKHKITNSFAEGINSVIQEIKTVARGFRNFANYRIAILFFCGKLDLYP